MSRPEFLMRLDQARYQEFGLEFRKLSERVKNRKLHEGTYLTNGKPNPADPPDPILGDPETGKFWLGAKGVIFDEDVKGVPIYAQTMEYPCIMLPPWELLADPIPPSTYSFPQFYCDQCSNPGSIGLPFYLKRLTDYTLSHCG